MAENYLVRSQDSVVETWSVKRLPFQAKSCWERRWKEKLKASLRQLPGSFVAARYHSPIRDLVDAENILFYNVGGAFATSTRDGLRFERIFDRQPSPVELNGPADHYLRYVAAAPQGSFEGWAQTSLLAEFDSVELPWLKFDSNPALVWFPLRQAGVTRHNSAAPGSPFALRLRVEVPVQAGAAASLAKTLFDGVVSALQAHDGWRRSDIATWMSERFGFDRAEVERLLEPYDAVLGTRRLFNERAGGFQWSPDDDLCVAGEIEVARTTRNERGFRLDAKLYAVAAV